jgi:hypothetical protein
VGIATALVLIGLAMIPLPGPGLLFILFGVALAAVVIRPLRRFLGRGLSGWPRLHRGFLNLQMKLRRWTRRR